MSEANLYNLYSDLRTFLDYTNPLIINNYDNEYLLLQIISDTDINTLKVTSDEDSFCIALSNFKNGYSRALITRDPFKSIENLFIEFNDLDGLSTEALNAVIKRNIGKFTKFINEEFIVYNIRSYVIDVRVIDESFEVILSKFDYVSKPYRFSSAYEAFRFISFIITQYIYMYFDDQNDMLLDMILDLYVEHGYKNIFIRDNDAENDNGEEACIKLITPNGDMYFTYNDGKIECEFYQELEYENVYHNDILDTCDDVLDWIARKSK